MRSKPRWEWRSRRNLAGVVHAFGGANMPWSRCGQVGISATSDYVACDARRCTKCQKSVDRTLTEEKNA